MTIDPVDESAPAGIEYLGVAGSSVDCQTAVERLVQGRVSIGSVAILTHGHDHALLLTTVTGDPVAVKSGFASGYGGSGPRALSATLQLLQIIGASIDEWNVDDALLQRLDKSALSLADLEALRCQRPRRPSRWNDYILEDDHERAQAGRFMSRLEPVIPWSILDPRMERIAHGFWADTDARLMDGYRRLEKDVRRRSGLSIHGSKLFSLAFAKDGPLAWELDDEGERAGRTLLFTGAFQAHRNPRAHRLPNDVWALSEFLLLNHLFLLEAEAIAVDADA